MQNFNTVTNLLDRLINFDKEAYVIEYFDRVQNEIVLEKEVNLQKLLAHFQKLEDEVHERKVNCLHNLKTNKLLENELDAIKQTLIDHESKLKTDNVDFLLKTLEGNEAKWRAIQSECKTLWNTIKSSAEEMKQLVGDQLVRFWPNTDSIQINNMCGHLFLGPPDSMIINTDKLKNDLVKLCNFSAYGLKLLYRAIRDGFKASVFYDKCNNHSYTLTIIKTTKGYIFGVFHSLALDSSNKNHIDTEAFVFSLVNASQRPQLILAKTKTKLNSSFLFTG